MSNELINKLNQTRDFLRTKISDVPALGIILGSGLSSFAKKVSITSRVSYKDIPHFSPPTVIGHPGELIVGTVENIPVLLLTGRIHLYEGHSIQQVSYPARTLAYLGVQAFLLTNAAGGLDPNMRPGDLMIINDHINLLGQNPLAGANVEELGPRFPDMSAAYDPELTQLLRQIMKTRGIRFSEGVYCGLPGPTYETPAEVRYLQKTGATAVGMSTVPETIVARHMGRRVCAISCITNLAAGLSGEKITHDEVTAVGKQVENDFSAVLVDFIRTSAGRI